MNVKQISMFVEEGLGSRVKFTCVTEKTRTFFLVRGKDRRSCVDGYNKIREIKISFEQLPGKITDSQLLPHFEKDKSLFIEVTDFVLKGPNQSNTCLTIL